VLFNTLAYARFLVLVFVAIWLLVEQRGALWLPWLATASFVAFAAPSIPGLLVAAALCAATWATTRRIAPDARPPAAVVASSVAAHGAVLTWFAWSRFHSDPLSLALQALSVPILPGLLARYALLCVLLLTFGVLLRLKRLRLLFIVVASYVFYAHWNWRFLPLIWGSSTLDYWLGLRIGRTDNARKRCIWLAATVIVNLGALGLFKYWNFGIDSARTALQVIGVEVPDVTLRLALPVGISFFTFESMSYVIDVYRRQIRPHESYLEYLGFVAFFPHLVAGPIIRPRDLLPQLSNPARFDARAGSDGLYLIATGLLKKVAIGDTLATQLIDRIFDAPLQYSGLECYLAVLGYAIQIYCDFSGYTDIAIGSAQLLGIRFPLNFNSPYKAWSLSEFWHRWHISLSTWLRDYLYIPLGGNKKGPHRTYVNSMLTMLLGGLWHGANWTFVVWGAIHGLGLAFTRWHERRHPDRPKNAPPKNPVWRVLSVFLTFHIVCIAWVFFRSSDFHTAYLMFARMATLSTYHPNVHTLPMAMLAVGFVTHFLPDLWSQRIRDAFPRLPAVAQGLALFLVALGLRKMQSAEAVPFVYFQF
jgi:D-alanyl-lipoteichoic acid acyltransferase DltB (MBOAT superfamily)